MPAAGCAGCAERDAVIAAQAAAIAVLEARLERLERLVSRNSGNSSFPPSTDGQPGRKRPKPRQRPDGTRSQGKQPGAPGSHLAWSAVPDERVAVFPEGACACGADLAPPPAPPGCPPHPRQPPPPTRQTPANSHHLNVYALIRGKSA